MKAKQFILMLLVMLGSVAGVWAQNNNYSLTLLTTCTDVPSQNDARQATVVNGCLYIQDKAQEKIYKYDRYGNKSVFFEGSGRGSGICHDDAGNIIVRGEYGYPQEFRDDETLLVINSYGETIEICLEGAGVSGVRNDYFSNVVGDMFDEAKMFFVSRYSDKVCCVRIAHFEVEKDQCGTINTGITAENGGMVYADATGKMNCLTNRSLNFVQGTYVFDEIDAEWSFTKNGTLTTPKKWPSIGADFFTMNNVDYVVYNSGTGYHDGFCIARQSTDANNPILAENPETETVYSSWVTCWQCVSKIDEHNALIYQFFPGEWVKVFLFTVEHVHNYDDENTYCKAHYTCAECGYEDEARKIERMGRVEGEYTRNNYGYRCGRLAGVQPVVVNGATYTLFQDYQYKPNENGKWGVEKSISGLCCVLTKSQAVGTFDIPSTINFGEEFGDIPVVAVGEEAIGYAANNVTALSIPASVKLTEKYALEDRATSNPTSSSKIASIRFEDADDPIYLYRGSSSTLGALSVNSGLKSIYIGRNLQFTIKQPGTDVVYKGIFEDNASTGVAVTFGSNVTSIPERCFKNFNDVEEYIMECDAPCTVDATSLNGSGDYKIIVHALTTHAWVNTSNWQDFESHFTEPAFTLHANEDPSYPSTGYYTTFYNSHYAYILPNNVKAYTAKLGRNEYDDEVVMLTDIEGNILPKGVAVLLYSKTISDMLLTPTDEEGNAPGLNLFCGVDVETEQYCPNYMLSYGQDGLGFYRMNEGMMLSANKAFLPAAAPAMANARAFRMVFEDEETGIENINDDDTLRYDNDNIYSVSGIRLNNLQKGINIVGGKKIVIK